jgi:hypothetical protein
LHSPSAVQEKEERLPQSTFVYSMVKLVAVILVAYILVNLGMQYTQRRLLDDEIQLVLNDRRTTVRSLRGRITSAITNRGLQVPKEQVKVTADVAQHTVTVRVDYQRTLLAIPLHYQVKREHTFNLPLPELAALPEGEIDIGGIAPGELERLRREGINKQITEKMGNYVGEADTLTEKQALEAERAEFERNLALFEVTSVDEAGREIRPQTIKIRGQDYSQEEARRHLDDLNTKIGDLQHLLQQQREKKRATLTEELQPSLPSR